MEPELLKRTIANNIALLRRQAGLTQAELAERLSYSDKAVSKWERGESLPDVVTLVQLAGVLGVSVDALTGTAPPAAAPPPEARKPLLSHNKRVVAALASVLVWFVALLADVVLSYCGVPGSWLGFVGAVPANAIVLLSLLSAWRYFRWNRLLVSLIVWGSLVLVFTALLQGGLCLPKIFLLGIPGQLAIFLWFRLGK